jgi:tetratricopeptide (TPR) repeat protein
MIEPARLAEYIATSGHDPRVLALANLSWLDVPVRGADAASVRANAAAEAALASPHSVSACYGFVLPALVLQQAGHWDEARRLAERALDLAGEKGIAYWVALARVALGHDASERRGDAEGGRQAIREGLSSYRDTQGEILRPYILCLLALSEAKLGDQAAAEETLSEAVEVAMNLEASGFLPELWLRQAMLSSKHSGQARRSLLRRSMDLARRQGAEAVARAAEVELRLATERPSLTADRMARDPEL